MKRIELRGEHLRASRTGGVSLRKQARLGQYNVTANTAHGVRLSRRIAKGTNLALQNGQLRLRGRYGKGPTKLNLAKSGLSVSTRNALGTFNWTRPQYSSANVLGVNVRGRKAANMQLVFMLFQAVVLVFKVLAFLLVTLPPMLVAFGGQVAEVCERVGAKLRLRAQAAWLERTAAASQTALPALAGEKLQHALLYVVGYWGSGHDAEAPNAKLAAALPPGEVGTRLDATLDQLGTEDAKKAVLGMFAWLASRYVRQAPASEQAETLLQADELCLEAGGRTTIQDRMIAQFAQLANVALVPATA